MPYNKLNIEPTQNFGASKSTIEKARVLRKEMTNSEQLLWEKLRKKQFEGHHFRRQHAIDCYIVDFYCHDLKLIIEIDGAIHQYQKEYDTNRQKFLEELGLKVIRFSNDEVEDNIEHVLQTIKQFI